MRQTLESARVDRARGVAVVTNDDMENIETGIVLLEILGSDTKAPIVLRVQGRALGAAVNQRFGFEKCGRSWIWRPPGSSARRWACRCWGRFGWGSAPSWSAECSWLRAAS